MYKRAMMLGVVGAFLAAGCAAADSDGEGASVETVRTAAGLHVTVFDRGTVAATLDYVERDHEARWSLGETKHFAPFKVVSLTETDAGDLAKALWRAAPDVQAAPVTSIRPKEIFYGAKPASGPTCTPYRACEPFLGGYACVEIYENCRGETWVLVAQSGQDE